MNAPDGTSWVAPLQKPKAFARTQIDEFERVFRRFHPTMRALDAGMGSANLKFVTLPDWKECQRVGEAMKAELGARCDGPTALKFAEWLIRSRANSKATDEGFYLKSVKKKFTRHSPAVVKEAVANLINASKFMPEISEIDRALGEAESWRRQLLSAARAAYIENQRRHQESEKRRADAAERADFENDRCWRAWNKAFKGGRQITFAQHRLECGGNGDCEACHAHA